MTNKGDDRRQEFLVTALNLFYEKGYEKTTIKDLIEEVGLSKGAFYHYFESKEELLESIAENYAKRVIQIMKEITNRTNLSALDKINTMIETVNVYKGSEEEKRRKIKGIFMSEGNLKLEKRIFNKLRESTVAFIEEVIESAVLEGTIETGNPKELAEFTLFMIHHLNASMDDLILEQETHKGEKSSKDFLRELEEKLYFYEEIFRRIYQLKEGGIHLRESYVERFMEKNRT